MTPRWGINIVAHERIYDQMYLRDPLWDCDKFTVINVSTEPLVLDRELPVIDQYALPRSRRLGPQWAESEAIFNFYLNDLHLQWDYVGFIHYDMELRLRRWRLGRPRSRRGFTHLVDEWVKDGEPGHLSFETHVPRHDYAQNILADFEQPDVLVGQGVNCYDKILADYNEFFGASVSLRDVLSRSRINLCSSFLIDTPTFVKMMAFFEWIIATRHLDDLDPARRHRLQGGLAERYFGVFLLFEYPQLTDMSLVHHNLKEAARKP